MPDPNHFTNAYGPYAFGVAAVVVLAAVLVAVWRIIVAPSLSTLADIAKHQAETAQAMKDTTESAERIMGQCRCRGQIPSAIPN